MKILIKINVATDEGNSRNERLDTEQTMKLEQLYEVGSECELNSWPDIIYIYIYNFYTSVSFKPSKTQ